MTVGIVSPPMRRTLLATSVAALCVASCTGTGTYKDQTEDFLEDDSQVETQVGGDVTGAECEEPGSTDVGTTYTCTADIGDTGPTTFDVCIDGDNSFLVQVYESGLGAGGGEASPCPPVSPVGTEA